MKRIAKLSFSCAAVIILFSVNNIVAQDKKIEDVFKWTYDIDKDGNIEFENYDCDLVIHTWDKAEVLFELSVNATFRNTADTKKFKDHIEEIDFESTAHELRIDNKYWSSRKNIAGIKTMKLTGNGNIFYREFRMKGELWIPADADLNLISKYSKISIDDTKGKLELKLYNDDIEGAKALNDVYIDAKYSNIEFTNFGELDAKLYDCDLNLGESKSAKFSTKYSEINCGNSGNLIIESYSDKYIFNTTGDINITSKYTSLKSETSGELIIDSYDGSVDTKQCDDVKLKSKYTDYTFSTVGNCKVISSYTDKFSSGFINSLEITESKYSDYKIEELKSSLILKTGYEDDFIIPKIGSDFREISLNGKYLKSEFSFADETSYRIKANLKYPHLDINDDNLTIRLKIIESSQLEYEAFKGTESPDMPVINITGYEIKVKINN